MPRQRFIWPTIWSDPVLGRLKEVELLFYIGCFSCADDDGRLLGDSAFLRGTIFPYSTIGTTKMKRIRDRVLDAQKRLRLYVVDGVEYLAFENWKEWQKPKYPTPSLLPRPPWDSGNGSGSGSGNDSGNDSPDVEEPAFNTGSTGRAGQGRDGSASLAEQNGSKTTPLAVVPALPDEDIEELGAAIEQRLGISAKPNTLEGIMALIPSEHRDENSTRTIQKAIAPLTAYQREVLHGEVFAAGPDIRNRAKYAVKIAQRLAKESA